MEIESLQVTIVLTNIALITCVTLIITLIHKLLNINHKHHILTERYENYCIESIVKIIGAGNTLDKARWQKMIDLYFAGVSDKLKIKPIIMTQLMTYVQCREENTDINEYISNNVFLPCNKNDIYEFVEYIIAFGNSYNIYRIIALIKYYNCNVKDLLIEAMQYASLPIRLTLFKFDNILEYNIWTSVAYNIELMNALLEDDLGAARVIIQRCDNVFGGAVVDKSTITFAEFCGMTENLTYQGILAYGIDFVSETTAYWMIDHLGYNNYTIAYIMNHPKYMMYYVENRSYDPTQLYKFYINELHGDLPNLQDHLTILNLIMQKMNPSHIVYQDILDERFNEQVQQTVTDFIRSRQTGQCC